MIEKITKLKNQVKNLQEDETKSLLFHILLRTDLIQDSDQELAIEIQEMFHDLLKSKEKQAAPKNNDKAVHLVFGDSAAGCLKEARKMYPEKVISIPDMLSIGPISLLNEEQGVTLRYEWLKHHILFEHDEDIQSKENRLNDAITEIKAIPEQIPVWIWSGENSHEQTGHRLALFLLRGKNNPVHVLNTAKEFREAFPHKANEGYPRHTGELLPDQLSAIYESNQSSPSLSEKARNAIEREWIELSSSKELLRIWENEEIKSVSEAFYDDLILDTVRGLQSRGEQGFMKAARVIGELIGHLDQQIGDSFYEYRLRHLIMEGYLEIYGVPKAMRYYSVRLRKAGNLLKD
ncbi:DUF1835 domain-containing protein [Bacillus sp. SJS]|uniref:DUF1835 domain-containing protein n=1 Tax=Bacillus sp. SJS TaxID=1423321 RepID=UPI0004DCF04D|nr:DUF1835 domain-containing protein [Bacillus sp. SJS]KZZ84479.1 hypothetical protein AS29_011545 [Bacillus sp. SJS]